MSKKSESKSSVGLRQSKDGVPKEGLSQNSRERHYDLVLTCEHAVAHIPNEYQTVINVPRAILNAHFGYDQGAQKFCHLTKKYLQTYKKKCTVFESKVSRLLVDHNRSIKNKSFFSKYSKALPEHLKDKAIKSFYIPYREKIFTYVGQNIRNKKPTVAISIHSFTPVFKGKVRKTDIGILFRPWVQKEARLANLLRKHLRADFPNLNIHFNLPYRGHTDCMLNDVSDLYLKNDLFRGIFIELSHKHVKSVDSFARSFARFLANLRV